MTKVQLFIHSWYFVLHSSHLTLTTMRISQGVIKQIHYENQTFFQNVYKEGVAICAHVWLSCHML